MAGETVAADRLAALRASVATAVERGEYDGGAYVVAHRGRIVAEEAVGHADRRAGRAARLDDVYAVHSITKPIIACLVATYVDDGRLELSTPVADLIPAFGSGDHRDITVLDLLTHRSGLSDRAPWPDWRRTMRLDEVVSWAAGVDRPRWPPGERVGYSPIVGHAVAAEVARRADGRGRSLTELLRDRVLAPCAMDDTTMGKPADTRASCVPQRVIEPLGAFPAEAVVSFERVAEEPGFEVPGAGLWSTVRDVARFAEMLRCEGDGARGRVLSPAMARLAVRNQTGDEPDAFAMAHAAGRARATAPPGFALSLKTRGTHPGQYPFGDLVAPETYGALGLGSTMFWVDPVAGLTFTILTAGLLEEAHSARRFVRLSNLVASALVPAAA